MPFDTDGLAPETGPDDDDDDPECERQQAIRQLVNDGDPEYPA